VKLDLAAPADAPDPLAETGIGRRSTDEVADRLLEIIAGTAEGLSSGSRRAAATERAAGVRICASSVGAGR